MLPSQSVIALSQRLQRQATPHEGVLTAFVDAVLERGGTNAAAIGAARSGVEAALGPLGVVQAAAVIGAFCGLNQLADVSGCQMDTVKASEEGGDCAILPF